MANGGRSKRAYPEPTLVVGIGRVGLSVLSRLGDDWRSLLDLERDESMRNLRLLHIRAGRSDAISELPDLPPDISPTWQAHEKAVRRVVRAMGEGDLPDTALDFAILRTCGFIRFRDGQYEVARPTEAGVAHFEADDAKALGLMMSPKKGNQNQELHKAAELKVSVPARLRYIHWLALATDPLVAIEKLGTLRQNDAQLDHFISRTIFRVRQGHSTRLMSAVISRMMAWLDGRDPSPWAWLRAVAETAEGARATTPSTQPSEHAKEEPGDKPDAAKIEADKQEQERAKQRAAAYPEVWPPSLKSNQYDAPLPVHSSKSDGVREFEVTYWSLGGYLLWQRLSNSRTAQRPDLGSARSSTGYGFRFRLPPPFQPIESDLPTPWSSTHEVLLQHNLFDGFPRHGDLRDDGSNQASTESRRLRGTEKVLHALDAEHGFFDSDNANWYGTASEVRHVGASATPHMSPLQHFQIRLREMGRLCQQGLVRTWDQLSKAQSAKDTGDPNSTRASLRRASLQCLELLGDAIVRAVLANAEEAEEQLRQEARRQAEVVWRTSTKSMASLDAIPGLTYAETQEPDNSLGVPLHLPFEPSTGLRKMAWRDPADEVLTQEAALHERLEQLGLPPSRKPARELPLLREVELVWEDVAEDLEITSGMVRDGEFGAEPTGLAHLRRQVDEVARELYDIDSLRQWRNTPSRRAPRLVVFLVADLAEPFARAALPTVLRSLHAILLRTLGPIFVPRHNGLDRALHIVPLVSFPQPSSAGAKVPLSEVRALESLIIETLQVVRRKLELAPAGATNVPHVLLQARVTDNAVHSVRRTIESVRDYITLFSRNEITAQARSDGRGGQTEQSLGEFFLHRGRRDLFSTFTIAVAERPDRHARWYFGNRMARVFVRSLRTARKTDASLDRNSTGTDRERAAAFDEMLKEAGRALDATAEQAQEIVADMAKSAATDLKKALDHQAEATLDADGVQMAKRLRHEVAKSERQKMQGAWAQLTGHGGQTDDTFHALRDVTAAAAVRDARTLRATADAEITHTLRSLAGMGAAEDRLKMLQTKARTASEQQARTAHDKRQVCASRGAPDGGRLDVTRDALIEAANDKPDQSPMATVGWLWLGVMGVCGAPLVQAVAKALELDKRPNLLEVILGPVAIAPAALVLGGITIGVLQWWLRRRTEAVRAAAEAHAQEAYDLFAPPEGAAARAEGAVGAGTGSAYEFLAARVEAVREAVWFGYTRTTHAALTADVHAVGRLHRSIDATFRELERSRDNNGVRTIGDADVTLTTGERLQDEDTTRFLASGDPECRVWLLEGRDISAMYRKKFESPARELEHVQRHGETVIDEERSRLAAHKRVDAPDLEAPTDELDWATVGTMDRRIARLGEMARWRQEAWLSDAEALIEFYARTINIPDMLAAADKVVDRNLEQFLYAFYPNMGYAAQFRGFEGLDEDSAYFKTEPVVLMSPSLATEGLRRQLEEPRTARQRLDVTDMELSQASCWMLAIAHDLQIDSIQNLKRFGHHFERARPPEDRLFPFTPQGFFPPGHALATKVPVTLTTSNESYLLAVRMAVTKALAESRRELIDKGGQPHFAWPTFSYGGLADPRSFPPIPNIDGVLPDAAVPNVDDEPVHTAEAGSDVAAAAEPAASPGAGDAPAAEPEEAPGSMLESIGEAVTAVSSLASDVATGLMATVSPLFSSGEPEKTDSEPPVEVGAEVAPVEVVAEVAPVEVVAEVAPGETVNKGKRKARSRTTSVPTPEVPSPASDPAAAGVPVELVDEELGFGPADDVATDMGGEQTSVTEPPPLPGDADEPDEQGGAA